MANTVPTSASSTSSVPRKSYIKIMQWNCNGITRKIPELKNFLASMSQQPDIICLEETHLNDRQKLKVPTYITERCDRSTGEKCGGVAILLKENLIYSVLEHIENLEEITVRIKSGSQQIIISNIYNPPRSTIDESKYQLLASRPNMILLGDFNAHTPLLGATNTNAEGTVLEKLVDDNHLIALNDKTGTYLKRDGNVSYLDATLAS
jgi:exonuclease III